jgi:hypothetical protein
MEQSDEGGTVMDGGKGGAGTAVTQREEATVSVEERGLKIQW